MLDRGLQPDFSREAVAEVAHLAEAPQAADEPVRDLRNLLWCSIDNDDSRDLDQLSVAEALPGGSDTLLVAVADVDVVVRKGSALDRHAPAQHDVGLHGRGDFSDAARSAFHRSHSLGAGVDRLAIVVELVVSADGTLVRSDIYGASVSNRAKLAYNALARGWPAADRCRRRSRRRCRTGRAAYGAGQSGAGAAARASRARRARVPDARSRGRYSTATADRPAAGQPNRAKQLIEDLMVAANGVVARFLDGRRFAVAPPCRAHAETVGPHRRTGGRRRGNQLPATPIRRALTDIRRRGSRRSGAFP